MDTDSTDDPFMYLSPFQPKNSSQILASRDQKAGVHSWRKKRPLKPFFAYCKGIYFEQPAKEKSIDLFPSSFGHLSLQLIYLIVFFQRIYSL